jgi:hypothetical protein
MDFLIQHGFSDCTTYTGQDLSFVILARKHPVKLALCVGPYALAAPGSIRVRDHLLAARRE